MSFKNKSVKEGGGPAPGPRRRREGNAGELTGRSPMEKRGGRMTIWAKRNGLDLNI